MPRAPCLPELCTIYISYTVHTKDHRLSYIKKQLKGITNGTVSKSLRLIIIHWLFSPKLKSPAAALVGDAAPDVGVALSECNYQSLSHPHSPKFLEHSPVSLHSLRKGFPELCLGSGSSFCAICGGMAAHSLPAVLRGSRTPQLLMEGGSPNSHHFGVQTSISGHVLSRKCLQRGSRSARMAPAQGFPCYPLSLPPQNPASPSSVMPSILFCPSCF